MVIEAVDRGVNNYLFLDREAQPETGYFDLIHRQYDPAKARFDAIDPKPDDGDQEILSTYQYGWNNPVLRSDPNGDCPCPPPLWFLNWAANSSKVKTAIFAINHPYTALMVGDHGTGYSNITSNSIRFATQNGNGLPEDVGSRFGTQRNAFRHTLWQAQTTNKFGSAVAKEAGDAHEDNHFAATGSQLKTTFNSLEKADETIDLLNNSIGRSIGEANKGLGMREMAVKVLGEFKENGLWTSSTITNKQGQVVGYRIERTKITESQYKQGVKTINSLDQNGFNKFQQMLNATRGHD